MLQKIRSFLAKEAVLSISAVLAICTMYIVPPDHEYLSYIDFRVLCLLFCLMAVVAGFKSVGAFEWLTYQLLSKITSGRILSITLVLLPFFSSMLVTNDVALLIFVPFTLSLLQDLGCTKNMVTIIVLQTVAANLGSMATPVGNPQNLYLYAAYTLSAGDFFAITLPLTLFSFVCLTAAAFPVLPKSLTKQELQAKNISSVLHLTIYGILFAVCLLTVFRVIPYPVTTLIILTAMLFLNRKLLKEVDYMLLITFICFFIISENLGRVNQVREVLQACLEKNALFTAIGASQIISNVPASVLLSAFTEQWDALLAGVNIGGLGTPIASLASLITLKLYMRWPGSKAGKFLVNFTAFNLAGLALLIGFSFIVL